jgi:Trehalose-phosphatase
MTRPILELYTESTDGSNIEAKDSALVRRCRQCNNKPMLCAVALQYGIVRVLCRRGCVTAVVSVWPQHRSCAG